MTTGLIVGAVLVLVLFFGFKLKLLWGTEDEPEYDRTGPKLGGPFAGPDEDEDVGRIACEAYNASMKEHGGAAFKPHHLLSDSARRAWKAAADAVLDADSPKIGMVPAAPEMCACGHFEAHHSLELPYPCQTGYVADTKDAAGKIRKRGRPSTCGCKAFAADKAGAA